MTIDWLWTLPRLFAAGDFCMVIIFKWIYYLNSLFFWLSQVLAAHADENNTSFHLHSKVCSAAGFFVFSYKLHLQETNLFFILLKNCGCSFRFRMPTSWEQIVASLWFINVAERSFQEISGKDVVWFCFANDVLQWFANTISAPDGQ